MGLGLVGVAFGLFGLSLVRSVWPFAAAYFLVGVFLAALAPNAAAQMAQEIPAQARGRAYGIWQAANTLGGFVAPLVAGIIGSCLGLRWVFAASAVVTTGGALLILRRGGGRFRLGEQPARHG